MRMDLMDWMCSVFSTLGRLIQTLIKPLTLSRKTVKETGGKSMLNKINISKDNEYYSQINNKRYPHEACNVTAITECMDIIDEMFNHPPDMQPEDYFMEFMRNDESYDRMRSMYPWATKGGYEPNEVHAMLQWGINKLAGRDVDVFSTKWDLRELLFWILSDESPSCVSGSFTAAGHIVVLVGFETKQDVKEINSWLDINLNLIENIIVDDPYGDYFSGYENVHGNNIKFSLQEFDEITKTHNDTTSKWAHLIRRNNG